MLEIIGDGLSKRFDVEMYDPETERKPVSVLKTLVAPFSVYFRAIFLLLHFLDDIRADPI